MVIKNKRIASERDFKARAKNSSLRGRVRSCVGPTILCLRGIRLPSFMAYDKKSNFLCDPVIVSYKEPDERAHRPAL